MEGISCTQMGGVNKIVPAYNHLCYSKLENLDLSNNFFLRYIPASLRSLRALRNLDILHHNFTGRIPSYLETIPLENLNISFNGFEGEVWSEGVFAKASAVFLVGNNQLCGGVPELQLPECRSLNPNRKKRLSLAAILVITLVSVLCVVAVLFFVFYQRKRKVEDDDPFEPISLVQVSYRTLYKATDGFSTRNLIGDGSFSSVYRGCLNKDGGVVAVKVLNVHRRRGGSKSFISECETLRNTRHRNLAKVITCCSSFDFQGYESKAIVYEFISNGSLDQWLHNEQDKVPRLGLLQRVCIALDVAYALDYLHHYAGQTIIDCDIKPSNILLDQDLGSQTKILHSEYQYRLHSSSSTGVRGTVGYAAPEYGVGSKVSRSGDMYSYGILLLEMITTKKPIASMFRDGLSLHDYAKTAMGDGAVFGIVDPVLTKNDEMCLRLLVEIGVSCSMGSPQR